MLKDNLLLASPISIEEIKILKGANYFSGGNVVQLKINLNEYNEVFTNQIEDFRIKLECVIPSLIEHHCSEGHRGGFFKRVEDGTLLGHVIEHVAIELQFLAGMDVSYGKTRSTQKEGVYNVVFRYIDEEAGLWAGKYAVHIINSILKNNPIDLNSFINDLIDIREQRLLGPSTQAIVNEIEQRDITWLRLDEYNLIQIGTGKYQKRLRATLTPKTSLLAVEIAQDRYLSLKMLGEAGLNVVPTILIKTYNDFLNHFKNFSGSFVLRSRYRTPNEVIRLFQNNETFELDEKFFQQDFIIQPYPKKRIFRILVINYKCEAAVCIYVPTIIGNGVDTIENLIKKLNSHPLREKGDKGKLSLVEIDDETLNILSSFKVNLETILPKNVTIPLKLNANPKNGSYAVNVSHNIHKTFVATAEKAVRIIGLDVASVSIVAKDLKNHIQKDDFIYEIHAAPNFRMYINHPRGKPKNIIPTFVDYVLENAKNTEIPLISVTGTKGKTTFCNIIYNCLSQLGFYVGLSSSSATVLGPYKINNNNNDVQLILKDPEVEVAIIETSVENILNYGLNYRKAHYGIVLNVLEDNDYQLDIKRLDDIAYAKSVVAENIFSNGYAILNADDNLVMEMLQRVKSKTAFFSKNLSSSIYNLIDEGHTCIILKEKEINLYHQKNIIFTINTDRIKLFSKLGPNYIDAILAAILTLFLFGVDLNYIDNFLKNN